MVKGGQVELSLRSIYMDLGIPMKVEMQSDSSTSNSLTDRLGAVPRTKHRDTRYNSGTRTSSRWRPQYQEGAHRGKIVQMLERSQSLLQHHNNTASLQDLHSADHGSHTPLQEDWTSVESSRRLRCRTENRQLSELVVNIETGAKLSETIGTVEELSTSHD